MFQRVLVSSGVFVALTLAAIWAIGLVLLWQIDRAERAEIARLLTEAREFYLVEGRDALVDELRREGTEPLWSEDDIFVLLEEEETIVVLRDPEFEPVAGFPGLYAGETLEETALDHPEIDDPLLAQSVELFDGSVLTVGRFIPEQIYEIWRFLVSGSAALVVIVLPLSLVTGYFLSRGVFRRLETLSTAAEAVATGQMSARAPLTGTGDEFDRLAAGVNQMLDRLEALTRNIEAVSVGVAHDLKTPLSNIQGRLELIRRDVADPDAVVEHLDLAEARLAGLVRVFDAMLRLGEIEAGRRRSAFAPVDLSALAQDMVDSYAPVFDDADKRLDAAILPGLTVEGDRELLTQLIANLFDNALEHSRDAARVHIAAMSVDGGVRLEIGDDGPGIPPNLRARVFERFFRGEASRTTPGNGLGLALVKAIADLHGAGIELLQNRPGAVFVLNFKPLVGPYKTV